MSLCVPTGECDCMSPHWGGLASSKTKLGWMAQAQSEIWSSDSSAQVEVRRSVHSTIAYTQRCGFPPNLKSFYFRLLLLFSAIKI